MCAFAEREHWTGAKHWASMTAVSTNGEGGHSLFALTPVECLFLFWRVK